MESQIPEKLVEFIRKEAERADYELLDISARTGRGLSVEVIIDKTGGILLDECGDFNRRISDWIDSEELFIGGYTLDVCSPGLDRVLKTEKDFSWARGKQVEIIVHEPVDSKSEIQGELIDTDEAGSVTVKQSDGRTVRLDKNNIAKAKLRVVI